MSLILGCILNTGYICRFCSLTHTKLSSHWTTATQSPPKKHVQIQIHPVPDLSNDFPCFSVVFPIIFPTRIRVSAPRRRQVGREDLARPRGSAADIPAEVRAAGRFAEHQEEIKDPDVGVSGLDFFLVNILWYIIYIYMNYIYIYIYEL